MRTYNVEVIVNFRLIHHNYLPMFQSFKKPRFGLLAFLERIARVSFKALFADDFNNHTDFDGLLWLEPMTMQDAQALLLYLKNAFGTLSWQGE